MFLRRCFLIVVAVTLLAATQACKLGRGTNTWEKTAETSDVFGVRTGHSSVVFDDKMWVIGGFKAFEIYTDVWHSTDGSTWTRAVEEAAFGERYWHVSLVFNDKMWVIGGWDGEQNTSEVWSSSDGVTWTLVTADAGFAGRVEHRGLVYNDKMWIIGGGTAVDNTVEYTFGDVWSSSDGVTWTRATGEAAFGARGRHASVVYDNKMWVIAGRGESGAFNDAWYSTDGAEWTRTTKTVLDETTDEHIVLVYDGTMWLIEGIVEARSSDGVTWDSVFQRATGGSPFFTGLGGKDDFTGLVYNDKMWVIAGDEDGGISGGRTPTNKVFYSDGI